VLEVWIGGSVGYHALKRGFEVGLKARPQAVAACPTGLIATRRPRWC
jgi:hypothetical protein